MKIVITGSTGQIGTQLLGRLDFERNEIVLIGRNRSKLEAFESRGATVREGSMLDPAFMRSALEGAEAYLFLPPPHFGSEDMIAEYRELAHVSQEAARGAGVQRIVHLSTLGAHLDREETGLIRGQHLAETIIREGAPHVLHLRCGFFLENYLGSLESIAGQGAIYLPVSADARYEFVATSDIARIARDLLETPTWTGHRVMELHGPATLTFGAVAEQFGEALGRAVRHVAVPPEAAIEAMVGMGMSQAYATDLTKLIHSIEQGILTPEFPRGDARVSQSGMTPKAFARQVLKPALERAKSPVGKAP